MSLFPKYPRATNSQIAEKAGSELARYPAEETLQDKTGTVTKHHRPPSQQADSPPTARQRTPYETMQPTCRLRILTDLLQWSNFGLDWGGGLGKATAEPQWPAWCGLARAYARVHARHTDRPRLETGRLAGLSAHSAHSHATIIHDQAMRPAHGPWSNHSVPVGVAQEG